MKVFIATQEGQGLKGGDHFKTQEGELVYLWDPQKDCMRGFDSDELTTTFKVVDMDIDKEEYVKLYSQHCIKRYDDPADPDWVDVYRRPEAELQLQAAAQFPEGIVLERCDRQIHPRPEYFFTYPPEEI